MISIRKDVFLPLSPCRPAFAGRAIRTASALIALLTLTSLPAPATAQLDQSHGVPTGATPAAVQSAAVARASGPGLPPAVRERVAPNVTPLRAMAPATTAALTAELAAAASSDRLSEADVGHYRRALTLQAEGNLSRSNQELAAVSDRRLVGHVMARRYLDAAEQSGAASVGYAALRAWLAAYADLPEAGQIYGLALPMAPNARVELRTPIAPGGATAGAADATASAPPPAGAIEPYDGRPGCYSTATDVAWAAGLTYWRQNDYARAAERFAVVAQSSCATAGEASAGAYWAARAELRSRHPAEVSRWLRAAAEFPRTLYGQLARRALGIDGGARPATATQRVTLTSAHWAALARDPAGRRAIGLLQLGMTDLAGQELARMRPDADDRLGHEAAATLMHRLGHPGSRQEVAEPTGAEVAGARYPWMAWQPTEGYRVDPALVHAIVRNESGFNPRAIGGGAAGLMQLLPGTARGIAAMSGRGIGGSLLDPTTNLTLGQEYLLHLITDSVTGADLIRVIAAYNVGPGGVVRWIEQVDYRNDPLLFLESLPARHTRLYVARVLGDYWIYRRDVMGQPTPSLDELAAGEWPRYAPPDGLPATVAQVHRPAGNRDDWGQMAEAHATQ